MKKRIIFILAFIIITAIIPFVLLNSKQQKTQEINVQSSAKQTNNNPIENNVRKFSDKFSEEKTLIEAGSMTASKSDNWWLNSGGYFYFKNGISQTVRGSLPDSDRWRLLYNKNNPAETDNGYHPQNIFRLVTRTEWKDYEQSVYYRINKYISSADSHRDASNGLLLFNRYRDGDNLYYTGLRVDGTAVIKKKIDGKYYTMAQKAVYPGIFNRNSNSNLLPVGAWIGVKSIVKNEGQNVKIELYVDKSGSGSWEKVAEVVDTGVNFGGPVINAEGFGGIRTDFMDVDFRDYLMQELKA